MSLINPGDFPIDPNTVDGTELASRLNRLKLAIFSGLGNPTRPPDITAGGVWSRLVSPGVYELVLFDGVADVLVAKGNVDASALALPFDIAENYEAGDLISDPDTGTLLSARYAIAAGSAFNPSDWNADARIDESFLPLSGGNLSGPLTLTHTDDGAGEGPSLTLHRESTSPAAADVLGALKFTGLDSAGNPPDTYAQVQAEIASPTAAAESGFLSFLTKVAGAVARRFRLGLGLYADGLADMGAGTVNALGIYESGTQFHMPIVGGPLTLSGTIFEITTAIPAWARKITINVFQMSLAGNQDNIRIQLGTAGGYEVLGYNSSCANISGTAAGSTTTAGFTIRSGASGQSISGTYVLTKHGSTNAWVGAYSGKAGASTGQCGGGEKTAIVGAVTSVRFSVEGGDTFDAGSVTWMIEG